MGYLNTNKSSYWFVLLSALLITVDANAQIPSGYYDDAVGKTGANLKSSLNGIISGHTTYPYTSSSTDVWDILKEADEDPNNSSNVIGIYSGFSMDADAEYASGSGWSREHVWAKSRGDFGTSQGPGTDCHHIVAEDISTNSARNNRNFDYGDSFYTDGSGTYSGATESKTSSDWIWEPRDSKKGDVARMIFYMATRYEGSGSEPDLELTETLLTNSDTSPSHAKLSVLLEWHLNDPVSTEEQARNEVIYSYQNNRNPFIDHPEYVCEIWTCPVITNDAPTFTSTATTSVSTSVLYTYNITTDDTDADALTITATTKPTWLTFVDNGDGTATLNGTPTISNVGDHNVVLAVDDGTDNTEQSFVISVSATASVVASDLFISEYIEGSSFNKGVEIANYTGAAIDLSDYSLFKQTNGSGAWGSELSLSGTLANNEVYVVVHSSAHADMQAEADLSTGSNAVTFNGNDPIALFKSGVLIDEVGTFNSTANYGKDLTMVRKSTVNAPNTSYTSSEWDSYSTNEFDYLGSHTFDSGTSTGMLYKEMITPTSVSLITGDESSGFLIGHLIDNSGLSATPTPSNYTTITSTENSADAWATTNPNGVAPALYFDSGVSDPVIEFTLAEMTVVNSFIGWGYNASNSSGIAAGTIEFSTDGGTSYGKVYSFDIGSAVLDPSDGGLEMLGGLDVLANYVRLTVTDNHKTLGSSVTGGDQVGFGEVKFIGETFDINYNGSWSGGSGVSGTPSTSDTNNNLIVTSGSATLSADVAARYIAIQNGASLHLNPNVSITAGEKTIINGASALVLKSDATGTANFIDNGFVYDYSGTATVERYMDDMDLPSASYHYISSPVNNHLKFTDMVDLYAYEEASLEWIHESNFTNFSNVNGYAIRYETTTTKSFTGELNTGDLSTAVTSTTNGGSVFEGKNLLGNPYPSSISADSLVDANNTVLNTTVYLWNGYDYSTYNTALHTGTSGSLGGMPDGNIAVGQAFFIEALTGSTINVSNTMRGNDSNLFFKEKSLPQFRVFATSKYGSSEFLLTEHKSSTFGKDKYDSEHLSGKARLSISILQDGVPYDIQSIPEIANTTLELQVESMHSQEVMFHLKDVTALEGYHIYLEDRENVIRTDLSVNEYTTYLSPGTDHTRFKLRVVKQESLFHAYINNGRLEIFGLDTTPTKASLISIDGKLVANTRTMQFENWNQLSKGVYILEISGEKYSYTQKIVK